MQQHRLVDQQFGQVAQAYLTSAVHAQGADLEALAALAQSMPHAKALDLGCGGGHVSFAMAPHVAALVAVDLSEDMLAVVAAAITLEQFGLMLLFFVPKQPLPYLLGLYWAALLYALQALYAWTMAGGQPLEHARTLEGWDRCDQDLCDRLIRDVTERREALEQRDGIVLEAARPDLRHHERGRRVERQIAVRKR